MGHDEEQGLVSLVTSHRQDRWAEQGCFMSPGPLWLHDPTEIRASDRPGWPGQDLELVKLTFLSKAG